MDYTIIGAEANLAARLQSIAEPGHIVVSYETFALVRDIVVAHALPPITMKGISRDVTPFAVEGMLDAAGQQINFRVRPFPPPPGPGAIASHRKKPLLTKTPQAPKTRGGNPGAKKKNTWTEGRATAELVR